MMKAICVVSIAMAAACLAVPAGAEDWTYDFELYLLGARLEGTAGSGP